MGIAEETLDNIETILYRQEKILERIAISLEKLASKPEKERLGPSEPDKKLAKTSLAKHQKKDSFREAIGGEVHKLIRIYIEAYQGRYGKNARPDVGGKVQGLMKNLLKDHPTNRLAVLIVAFLQMDDPWFKTKNHDFPTLYENLGKVQTAFRNGTPRAEDKSYWDKVFGRGKDDGGNFQSAGGPLEIELSGGQLQRGESRPLLANPKDNS